MEDSYTLVWSILQWLVDNLAVLLGVGALVFTACQIYDAKRTYQASTVAQIAASSDELRWRVLDNPDLRELLTGTPDPTRLQQQQITAGLIINHFATIYDLYKLGGIPSEPWKAFKHDIKDTLSRPFFLERWQILKPFHTESFVRFVDIELGLPEAKPQSREEG